MKTLGMVALLAVLLAPVANAAVVTRVIDGDTLDTNEGRVRVACIDAPETAQGAPGRASTTALARLAPVGSTVALKGAQRDRYGRQVSEVWRGSTNVGLALVASGQAFVYRQYLKAPCNAYDYEHAEQRARGQQLGIWGVAPLVKPWNWRRGVR